MTVRGRGIVKYKTAIKTAVTGLGALARFKRTYGDVRSVFGK